MGGEHSRRMRPTLPSTGAFMLLTGAYKWPELRSIARVVSQVHAFQELASSDIHLLATDNDANFQQPSEQQTCSIQDTLKRVKATFQ
uniref:Uncharacterized protein n=1 Tax=Monopterus albus TaxID=43700 RepID=A0A3Q3J678_MONAL